MTEDGFFHRSDSYRNMTSDPADLADVEREAAAQYQAFVIFSGREPDNAEVHEQGSR